MANQGFMTILFTPNLTRRIQKMWLDNIKELKKKTGLSAKQIAEKTNLPERTVARVFS